MPAHNIITGMFRLSHSVLLIASLVLVSACSDPGGLEPQGGDEMTGPDMVTSVRGEFAPVPGLGKEAGGFATLHVDMSGATTLDFSDSFHVTNGPGLFVILSNADFPTDDAVNLGEFKMPMGSQMYEVPASIELASYSHVLIHCIPYNVTFATAELK